MTASGALQGNPAYMQHQSSKPNSRGMRKDWKVSDIESKFNFVASTRFPCQENEVITTIQGTETAEGNRLSTWLYWTIAGREASRKRDA